MPHNSLLKLAVTGPTAGEMRCETGKTDMTSLLLGFYTSFDLVLPGFFLFTPLMPPVGLICSPGVTII